MTYEPPPVSKGFLHYFFKTAFWILFPLGILLFIGQLYLFYSYYSVQEVIENRLDKQEWAIPSVIYAQPPLLFEGKELSADGLVDYLQQLEYYRESPGQMPREQGEYSAHGKNIAFKKRRLFYTKENYPPVLVEFEKNKVKQLTNMSTGEQLPNIELEPVTITNLFGEEWEKRTIVFFDDLPKHLIEAVLAIEDRRFAEHSGLDFHGILRAAWKNITGNKVVQGGSTITQQLVKNFYLTPERSYSRKINEAMLALMLERRLEKYQIFELYLNEIYLGQRGSVGIHGMGEASRWYFDKDLQHITVPEAAFLAGLIQAPSAYNPFRNPEAALERRDTVLLAMRNLGYLNPDEYSKYIKEPLGVSKDRKESNPAPYFGDLVSKQMLDKYPPETIYRKNLRIFTTLDLEMQRYAEEALSEGLSDIDKARGAETDKPIQGCLIAVEPATGYIRAFMGGRSYSKTQFNRVIQASRQPGSVFKPVVYAAALEEAFGASEKTRKARGGPIFTTASLLRDEPWSLPIPDEKPWEPKNYDNKFHGMVTMRTALTHSMNVATARLAMDVGLPKIAALGKKLGFVNVRPYPSIALGAFEANPWHVATAFTVFANGGKRTDLRTVRKITDASGNTLQRLPPESKEILHPETAFIITDMLRSVMLEGTAASVSRYGFKRPAAGKTGTTNDFRDAWFVGYTPELLVIVWVGYDDNTSIGMNGSEAALPIWAKFMKKATEHYVPRNFSPPEGLVIVRIDPYTGALANEYCPVGIREIFIRGTQPTRRCDQHQSVEWAYADRPNEFYDSLRPGLRNARSENLEKDDDNEKSKKKKRGFWKKLKKAFKFW